MLIKVQKRNGQLDDFDRGKVAQGVTKSGATSEQAESIAVQVEAWAQTAAVNGVISAAEIRMKVLELLQAVNPEAAASFETYRKVA